MSTQQKEDRKKKCRKAATSVHTTWAGRGQGDWAGAHWLSPIPRVHVAMAGRNPASNDFETSQVPRQEATWSPPPLPETDH